MSSQLSKTDHKWFRQFAADVYDGLALRLDEQRWLRPRSRRMSVTETNSGGLAAQLGSVKGDRGSQLQLWFDFWTGAAAPKIAYSYGNISSKRIREMAESGIGGLSIAQRLKNGYKVNGRLDGVNCMSQTLPVHLFGKPILETTDRSGFRNHLAVYESATPQTNRSPSHSLTNRTTNFLVEAAVLASAARARAWANRDFPAVKNRGKVGKHKTYERNAAQAAAAKVRSDYRCCVCDMKFEDIYGSLGKDFAEAHHTAYVSRLDKGARIVIDDLVTVCANCHRMLHRMEGVPDDWRALRKKVHTLRRKR